MYCKIGTSLKNARKINKKGDTLWHNMLNRCYNKHTQKYSYYGGSGVQVSKNWLNENTFLNDIKVLTNYEEWLTDKKHIYSLDKDILGNGKLYSKETCMFATTTQQNREHDNVHKIVCVDNNNNDILIFDSMNQIENSLNIHRNSISRILRGEQKQYKDYNFMYLDEFNLKYNI